MISRPVLRQTVLDAPDVRVLAEFYRAFLGLRYRPGDEPPVDGASDDLDWLVLRWPDGGSALAFQQNEALKPTTWPSPEVPMQLHLDLTVPDVESLEAARGQALSLGARHVFDRSEDPEEPLHVFADPVGHPFCVFVA